MRIQRKIELSEDDIREAIWFLMHARGIDIENNDHIEIFPTDKGICARYADDSTAETDGVAEPARCRDDTQPAAPYPTTYPKRSEVSFSPEVNWKAYWCANSEPKVFDNEGRYICMDEELQDG